MNGFIREKCWRINPSVHNFLQTGRRSFINSYLIFFTVWFCENKDACHVCKFKLNDIERTRLLSACLKVKINIKIINLWVYSGMKESIVVEYFFKCQNFFYVFILKHLQLVWFLPSELRERWWNSAWRISSIQHNLLNLNVIRISFFVNSLFVPTLWDQPPDVPWRRRTSSSPLKWINQFLLSFVSRVESFVHVTQRHRTFRGNIVLFIVFK